MNVAILIRPRNFLPQTCICYTHVHRYVTVHFHRYIGDADYGSQVSAETTTHKNGKLFEGKGLLPCKSVHERVNQFEPSMLHVPYLTLYMIL